MGIGQFFAYFLSRRLFFAMRANSKAEQPPTSEHSEAPVN